MSAMSPDAWTEEEHWAGYEPTEEAPSPAPPGRLGILPLVYATLVDHPNSTGREIADMLGIAQKDMSVHWCLDRMERRDGTVARTGGGSNATSDPIRWAAVGPPRVLVFRVRPDPFDEGRNAQGWTLTESSRDAAGAWQHEVIARGKQVYPRSHVFDILEALMGRPPKRGEGRGIESAVGWEVRT